MATLSRFIPDDWRAAWNAFRALRANAQQSPGAGWKRLVASIVPVLGALVGIALVRGRLSDEAIGAMLAFGGIVAGFTVTLMLITGKAPESAEITLEQSRAYVRKVRFMMWSQLQTLMTQVALCLVCVVALMLDPTVHAHAGLVVSVALVAVFVTAVYRTALLPFQIFEVNDYTLALMVRTRERARDRDLAMLREARIPAEDPPPVVELIGEEIRPH
jgi:hypothetical protein